MWWRVPPAFGMAGIGQVRPPGGPLVVSECGRHVARWPLVFGAWCCTETRASRRGHVTCSVFARGTSYALVAGVGAERGALGHGVGRGGYVADRGGREVDEG